MPGRWAVLEEVLADAVSGKIRGGGPEEGEGEEGGGRELYFADRAATASSSASAAWCGERKHAAGRGVINSKG